MCTPAICSLPLLRRNGSDSDSNGSGTDTDRDLSRATDGGSSDSERNIVDEAAVVIDTVDVIDDDGAAKLLKVQAYTEQEPYSMHSGHKVYVLYDPQHLVKNVRNRIVMKNDIEYRERL